MDDPATALDEKKKADPFSRTAIEAQVALAQAVALCRSVDRYLSDIEGGIRELPKNSPGAARIRRAKRSLQTDLRALRRNFAVLASAFIARQPDPHWHDYARDFIKELLG